MSWASNEIVGVLAFLLPGFVAAGVFHSFTAHPRPDAMTQVVRALIATAIVQAVAAPILLALRAPGADPWDGSLELPLSIAVAAALGLLAAWTSNKDALHRLLRRLGVTRETSYPSELYSAFASQPRYVVLHLKGERRLYGWPEEWPRRSGEGYFRIGDAEWLLEDGKRMRAEGVAAILVGADEVEMIEFMKEQTESSERR